ncbi:hypothetical protein IIY66_00830 [Candidatus Saccharibacteria bacterium]|nr:hypothetical protein [Candidatus Saccharibacteria bacterium]
MQTNSSTYSTPSFAKRKAYDFGADEATLAVYKELTAIAEEIEKCRARNT